MSFDSFGDRMKTFEAHETSRRLLHGVPVIARMDGRSFHTVTSKFDRPYEMAFSELMCRTTIYLVKETGACFGYTQSDEITLVWKEPVQDTQLWFDGKIFKMTSGLAAEATGIFNSMYYDAIPEAKRIQGLIPKFDARVFAVPNRVEAANQIWWRELDATRNSMLMAAYANFSHKECLNKNLASLHDMLHGVGINWNDYPPFFKRGVMVQARKEERPFTADELDKLPPKHQARTQPDLKVLRKVIEPIYCPPFAHVSNRTDVIFEGAKPASSWQTKDKERAED